MGNSINSYLYRHFSSSARLVLSSEHTLAIYLKGRPRCFETTSPAFRYFCTAHEECCQMKGDNLGMKRSRVYVPFEHSNPSIHPSLASARLLVLSANRITVCYPFTTLNHRPFVSMTRTDNVMTTCNFCTGMIDSECVRAGVCVCFWQPQFHCDLNLFLLSPSAHYNSPSPLR